MAEFFSSQEFCSLQQSIQKTENLMGVEGIK
ncbi:hypothetical protein V6Z12_D10G109000 [Gossypium hirsutum]